MAKNQHTFAKRQREMEKRRKAEEKRTRRQGRSKDGSDESVDAPRGAENSSDRKSTGDEAGTGALGTPERPLSVYRPS